MDRFKLVLLGALISYVLLVSVGIVMTLQNQNKKYDFTLGMDYYRFTKSIDERMVTIDYENEKGKECFAQIKEMKDYSNDSIKTGLLTRYEAVEHILKDNETFLSKYGKTARTCEFAKYKDLNKEAALTYTLGSIISPETVIRDMNFYYEIHFRDNVMRGIVEPELYGITYRTSKYLELATINELINLMEEIYE